MAYAAFNLMKCTGTNAATETNTSKAPSFFSNDVGTGGDAIAVPGSGSTRSYECWLRLKCTTAPDNYAENFDVWGPATQPDDPTNKLTIYIGKNATGVTPINTASTIAATIQHTNHYEAGNALAFDIANETITAVNDETQYVVLQLKVDAFASSGNMLATTFSISWDEA